MKALSYISAAILGLATAGVASAEGSGWVLNLERSALVVSAESPSPAVQPAATKAHLMLISTGVAPKGREGDLTLRGDELSYDAEMQFAARLDGRDYPIHGLPLGDSIAIEVQDGDAVVSTIKANGNKVASFKRSLDSETKTMIVTARYFGDDGKVTARERLIFERR